MTFLKLSCRPVTPPSSFRNAQCLLNEVPTQWCRFPDPAFVTSAQWPKTAFCPLLLSSHWWLSFSQTASSPCPALPPRVGLVEVYPFSKLAAMPPPSWRLKIKNQSQPNVFHPPPRFPKHWSSDSTVVLLWISFHRAGLPIPSGWRALQRRDCLFIFDSC